MVILHGIDVVDTGLVEATIYVRDFCHVRLSFIVPSALHIQLFTLLFSLYDYGLDFYECSLDGLAFHFELKIVFVEGDGDFLLPCSLLNFLPIFLPQEQLTKEPLGLHILFIICRRKADPSATTVVGSAKRSA